MLLLELELGGGSYLVRARWNGSYDTHEIPQIKPEGVSGHRIGMKLIVVL